MNDSRVTIVPNPQPAQPGLECVLRARALDEDTELVAAEGGLDLSCAPELKWAVVNSFAAGRRRVVVDLSRVSFIDSTSIGVLVAINRKLAPDQRLLIGGVAGRTLEVFRLAGVEGVLRLYPTVEAAISGLGAVSGVDEILGKPGQR